MQRIKALLTQQRERFVDSSHRKNSESLSKPKMIQLKIRNFQNSDIITITIQPNVTVEDLKKAITDHTTIPSLNQCLVYRGRKLEVNDSLTLHGISEDSLVHLVVKYIEPITVIVYCPGLRKIKMHLFNKTTVRDLREAVAKVYRHDTSQFKCSFHGVELNDNESTFADLKIKNKSKILVYDVESDA